MFGDRDQDKSVVLDECIEAGLCDHAGRDEAAVYWDHVCEIRSTTKFRESNHEEKEEQTNTRGGGSEDGQANHHWNLDTRSRNVRYKNG